MGPEREETLPGHGLRLRLLMVTPRNPLGQGGVELHVMEVSRRLVAAGVSVTILCGDPGARRARELYHEGIVIRSVPAWPRNRDYYLAPAMWREMRRGRWDVVHVQSYNTLVAPLAMLRALTLRVPYVVTFHSGGHSSWLRQRVRVVQRRALRPLLARAARLIAVARFEIDEYGRELGIPAGKWMLIPNGSDIATNHARDCNTGSETSEILLASIGRLERYKGHHRVIDALPFVLERRSNVKLLIVGSGPYEGALRRQVDELGVGDRVEFMSIPQQQRGAMSELLQRLSLVVLLSDFESGGITGVEAAAMGRPLLVADRAGLKELAEDGLARAIDPDTAPDAVAAAILESLDNPRKAKSKRLMTWDECSAALLSVYREIAGRPADVKAAGLPTTQSD